MRCGSCREALSARLDGEDPGVPASAIEAHLASCAGCREWLAAAERLHRHVRIAPAEPVPDLTVRILAATAGATGSGRVKAIRWGLLLVAAGQLAFAVPDLAGQLHLGHEVASWTVAAAVGFLAVAWRPRRVSGALPVMAAAAVALAAISVRDIATGHVHVEQEGTHLLLVAGVLLLIVLWRGLPDDRSGPVASADASGPRDGDRTRRSA